MNPYESSRATCVHKPKRTPQLAYLLLVRTLLGSFAGLAIGLTISLLALGVLPHHSEDRKIAYDYTFVVVMFTAFTMFLGGCWGAARKARPA